MAIVQILVNETKPILTFTPRRLMFASVKFAGGCWWGTAPEMTSADGVNAVAGELITFAGSDFRSDELDKKVTIYATATVATTARVAVQEI